MHKWLSTVLGIFLVLAVACGGEGEGELTTAQRTAGPETSEPRQEPTTEPAEGGDDAADDVGDPEPNAQTGDGDQPASTQAPDEPQGSSGVNPPADGTYVYDLEGNATDPFNPTGPPREFSDDAEAVVDVTHDGDVYTSETTTTEPPPQVATVKTKWESSRVLLLSLKTETGGGDFGCVFDPPIVATKLPPAPEAYATQDWQCKDSEGSGSTDITIVGQEDVTDANGKTWSTWKVETHTSFDFGQASGVQDDTRWVAPELGMDVRSEGSSEGEFELGAGQSQPFTSESRTLLKRHPGS